MERSAYEVEREKELQYEAVCVCRWPEGCTCTWGLWRFCCWEFGEATIARGVPDMKRSVMRSSVKRSV